MHLVLFFFSSTTLATTFFFLFNPPYTLLRFFFYAKDARVGVFYAGGIAIVTLQRTFFVLFMQEIFSFILVYDFSYRSEGYAFVSARVNWIKRVPFA